MTSTVPSLPPVATDLKDRPVLRIAPSKGWVPLQLRDLWDYRELIVIFAQRDLSIRYRDTLIGALWAILQPVSMMIVFTFLMGHSNRAQTTVPYPVYCYCGLLVWQYFNSAVNAAAMSLVNNSGLLTKVFFPRLLIPIANLIPPIVDSLISFTVLIVLLVYYRIPVTPNVLWSPVFFALALVTTVGASFWLSALNTFYRDVKYALPFLLMMLMYLTPVVYSADTLHGPARSFCFLNPLAVAVEGFRWSVLGVGQVSLPTFLIALGIAAGLFLSGAYYFRNMESNFADWV